MHILMFGQAVSAGGGIAEVIHNLEKNMGRVANDYKIITIPTSGRRGLKSQYRFLFALIALVRLAIRREVIGAHLHLASRGSTRRKVLICILLRFFRIPYLIQVHSGDYSRFYSNLSRRSKDSVKVFFNKSVSVVVLSEEMKGWVKSEFPTVNVSIVRNGVEDLGAGPLLIEREKDVVFVGRLVKTKGVYELLEALSIIKSQFKGIKATIVGDGELERCINKARDLSVLDFVDFLGWRSPSEVRGILKEHKIFVLPSWFEGLPMSMIEAMSTATTVIISDVGGVGDVISDGENGVLCEPRDVNGVASAIKSCLCDISSAQDMADKGRSDFVKRYSSIKMCENYNSIYHQVFKF